MFPTSPLSSTMLLSVLLLVAVVAAHDGQIHAVKFTPQDISHISYYGDRALYRPQLCPASVTFTARARPMSELADDKVAIHASDILMDDEPCTGSAPTLLFSPIGTTDHLPPQWLFEDSALTKQPVNFTCGSKRYAILYGYLNDVKTPSGFLDDSVVYLDFAVIPNTHPFSFCSYAARRTDGDRPVNYEPFPTVETWNKVREARNLPPLPEDQSTDDEELMMGSDEPMESPEHMASVVVQPVQPLPFPSPEAMVRTSLGVRVVEAVSNVIGPTLSSIHL